MKKKIVVLTGAGMSVESGLRTFRDADGPFEAEIADVEFSGHLVLRRPTGRLSRYALKEVSFLLPSSCSRPSNA